MSGQRVLILGAGGYLGRRVMDHLRALGVAPVGADIVPVPGYAEHLHDMRFPEQSFALFHKVKPDVVISLAYLLTAASISGPHNAVHTNILGINGVFDACAAMGIPRVLFASSNVAYGDQTDLGSAEANEDSPRRPRSLYSWMKVFNEVMSEHYNATSATRIISLRLSSLHGRGKTGIFNPFDMVMGAVGGERFTLPWSRSHEFSFLHVEDAAEMFARLALAPTIERTAYDSGGDRTTMEMLAEIAGPLCGLQIGFEEPGRQIDHLSRISGARLAEEFKIPRRPLAHWVKVELADRAGRPASSPGPR